MLCVGEGPRGSSAACSALCWFLVTSPLPTIKLGPSGADSQVGWSVYVLGPCGSLQQTLLWGWEFFLLPPQPLQVFSIKGLRLYFPALKLWVARSVSLPSCSSWFICTQIWDLPLCQPPPHPPRSSSHHFAASPVRPAASPRPSYPLDECFFFISLVVGLPYSSIFWQFWVFLFLNVLLSLFWLCEEAQCVYLRLRLGRKSGSFPNLRKLETHGSSNLSEPHAPRCLVVEFLRTSDKEESPKSSQRSKKKTS